MTLDTVADESRKKMADGVAKSPSRLCTRDEKICCSGDALSTVFSLASFCALLPTFRFSFLPFLIFSLHPGMFIFFMSLRVQPSATLSKYVFIVRFFLLVSFIPYPISEFFCFLFVWHFGGGG